MYSDPNQTYVDPALLIVRTYIEKGGFEPGDRLPPERQLIEELGMSRGALRRALAQLEEDGRIWRHVGKGTFIADPDEGGPEGSASQLARRTSPFELMRARIVLEPAIAREAALNASEATVRQIAIALRRCADAVSLQDHHNRDIEFHRAIAVASNNQPLIAVFDQLTFLRRSLSQSRADPSMAPWHANGDKPPCHHDHTLIYEAVRDGNPDAAERTVRSHLLDVAKQLF